MSLAAARIAAYRGANVFLPLDDGAPAPAPPACTPDANDSTTPNNLQSLDEQCLHPGAFRLWLGSAAVAPREVHAEDVVYDLACDPEGASLTLRVCARNKDADVGAALFGLGRIPGAFVVKSWQTCDGVELVPKIERTAKAEALYEEARKSSRHNASLATSTADAEYFELGKVPAGAPFSFHVVVRLPAYAWMPEVSPSAARRSFCDVGVMLPATVFSSPLAAAPARLTVRVAKELGVALPSRLVAEHEASAFFPASHVVWMHPEAFGRDAADPLGRRIASFATPGLYFSPLFKLRVVRDAHVDSLEDALNLLSMSRAPTPVVTIPAPSFPSGTAAFGDDDELVPMVASLCRVCVPAVATQRGAGKPLLVAISLDASGSMVHSSTPAYEGNNERLSKRQACQVLRTLQATTLPAMEAHQLLDPQQELLFSLVGFHSSAWEIASRKNLRSADDVEAACAALMAPCGTGGTSFVSFAETLLAQAKEKPAGAERWAVLLLTDGGAADRRPFLECRARLAAHVDALAVSVLGFGAWVDAETARAACTFGTPCLLDHPDAGLVRETLKIVPRMISRLLSPRTISLSLEGAAQDGLQLLAARCVGGGRPQVQLPSLLENRGLRLTACAGDVVELLLRYPKGKPLVQELDGIAALVDSAAPASVEEDGFQVVASLAPSFLDAVAQLSLVDPLFVPAGVARELLTPAACENARKEHIVHVAKQAGLITSETAAVAVVPANVAAPPKEAIPPKASVMRLPALSTRSPVYRSLCRGGDDDGVEYRSMGADVPPSLGALVDVDDAANALAAREPPSAAQWIAATYAGEHCVNRESWRAAASKLLLEPSAGDTRAAKRFKPEPIDCLDAALDGAIEASPLPDPMVRYVAAFPLLFPGHAAVPSPLPASPAGLRALLAQMVAAAAP